MYAALWRVLPGPVVLRAIVLLALLVAVVVVCFEWIFPLVASWLPYDETTVDTGGGARVGASAGVVAPSSQLFSLREDLR